MGTDDFIGYVGDADFHDGSVVSVQQTNNSVSVKLRGASGREYVVEFLGVKAVRANHAEGMMIYSLSEMRGQPPVRRFVFTNWNDDDDNSSLEIDAENFSVIAVSG